MSVTNGRFEAGPALAGERMKYVLGTIQLLADNPLVLLAALLALGAALGRVAVAGVRLGPAAVLFVAIAISAVAASRGVLLEIPEEVGLLGLILFTYTVGIISGPGFFGSLRSNWRLLLSIVGVFVVLAGLTLVGGRLLGLPPAVTAGTFAGGLTNTPALAAVSAESGDPVGATIGYSISYLWGVLGMLVAASWALRRPDARPVTQELVHRTIRVERTDRPRIEELEAAHRGQVTFSRVRREDVDRPTLVAEDDLELLYDDLVTVVGPADVVDGVAEELGHTSSHDIVEDRRLELDYRRITLSNPRLVGLTLDELGLTRRFGARISRVRRGDVDLIANDDFVVQMGDRLRVIAPADEMRAVTRHLGDSTRGYHDINPTGFGLGLLLGILLGLVTIPLPGGGGFQLGAACGTLLVGLLFGRLGRVGPVMTSMSHPAAQSLSVFGMITFLAYAGARAGQRIVPALTSPTGGKVALLGFAVTSLATLLVIVAARRLHRVDGVQLAGLLAGAQTQPAVLAFAVDRSGSDSRVGMGYALVYPAAMIAKILLAQLLV